MVFYNKEGRPVAYCEDDAHVYLYDGTPVGYFDGDSLYSYSGTHLGWLLSGWVRDHEGSCVFFTDDAASGPTKPLKQLKPLKGLKQLRPLKGLKGLRPLRPLKSLSWSDISSEKFFEQ